MIDSNFSFNYKTIPHTCGSYILTDTLIVYSCYSTRLKRNTDNYYTISAELVNDVPHVPIWFRKDDKRFLHYVHLAFLAAKLWLPESDISCISYKDGNPKNVTLSNLYYGSPGDF